MKKKDRVYKLQEIDSNIPKGSIIVSYSQFSKWAKCPKSWKLAYIDKIRISKPSIHAIFGTAIHQCIQEWIETIHTESVKAGDGIDFGKQFLSNLKSAYAKEVERYKDHFSTKEELSEFYTDGLAILDWVRKKRKLYFDPSNTQFVGNEIQVLIPPDPNKPNVLLMCYLDVVTRDVQNTTFLIRDLKTSTRGWSEWDKKDKMRAAQLLLYKIYFSRQYNIPIDQIQVEFLILKRKIDENSEFPQRRVQSFVPAQKSTSLKQIQTLFDTFIETCFTTESTYNTDVDYPPISGDKYRNCRFCEFNSEEHCPIQNRICT